MFFVIWEDDNYGGFINGQHDCVRSGRICEELVGKCRFSDCSHGNESGCAVRQAVKDGLITEERYRVYMRLKAENAYNKNAVDYLVAKKRKFKQIAKLNKHNYKQ